MKPKRGVGNICFDIDGTLCNEICFTEKEVRNATLNKKMAKLAEYYYLNGFLILYTARREELIGATLKWLRLNGVRYHAISNIKIPASMYVDDKAKEI